MLGNLDDERRSKPLDEYLFAGYAGAPMRFMSHWNGLSQPTGDPAIGLALTPRGVAVVV